MHLYREQWEEMYFINHYDYADRPLEYCEKNE